MPLGEVEQLSQVVRHRVDARKSSQDQMIDRFISHDSDSMFGGLSNNHQDKISLLDHQPNHNKYKLIEMKN